MDEVQKALDCFISVLNAEAKILVKLGVVSSEDKPEDIWRYYGPQINGTESHELLPAYLEAGRYVEVVESAIADGNELEAWKGIAKAQFHLLYPISSLGKQAAKNAGLSMGGKKSGGYGYGEIRDRAISLAIHHVLDGEKIRGLAAKVAKKLSEEGEDISEDRIRQWIAPILDRLKRLKS